MTDRELMQQALEALERYGGVDQRACDAEESLRERLAQPEQEPVAWLIWLHGPAGHFDHKQFAEMEFERRNKEYPDPDRKLLPLYTTPPRQWQGLTEDEKRSMVEWAHPDIIDAIELKLRERNT